MASIEGLDELLANLSGLGGDLQKSCKKGLERGAKKIQKNAKLLAPVKTGQLRNSIRTKTQITQDGAKAQVYTNAEHAVYAEFGTGQRGAESNIDRPERSNIQSRLERYVCTTVYDTSISARTKYWRSRTRNNKINTTRYQ